MGNIGLHSRVKNIVFTPTVMKNKFIYVSEDGKSDLLLFVRQI
jgi:hypothetical protein